MNEIEKQLIEETQRIHAITAPDQLEDRLRKTLKNRVQVKGKKGSPIWKTASIAVALLFVVMAGYHYNAIAYYGKQLIGFDELNTKTLNDLNQKGAGQVIDKKVKLSDGAELTIDGLITDAHYLFLYYTISNLRGITNDHDVFAFAKITGFLTKSNRSWGTFMLNDEQTELKGMVAFEPVSPFAKQLTLHYMDETEGEKQITFAYNPNKALQTRLEKKIKEKVNVDRGTIHFKSLTATPTSTIVSGTLSVDNFDRVNLGLHGIHLMVNGEPMEAMGSSASSTFNGQKFTIDFDALPEELHSLSLVVEDFVGYEKLNKEITLTSANEQQINIGDKTLLIKRISITDVGVEMTIATDEDVMLDGVSIKGVNEETEFQTIVRQTIEEQDGRLVKERTLIFKTKENPELLLIDGMHYLKRYDKKIEINVNK